MASAGTNTLDYSNYDFNAVTVDIGHSSASLVDSGANNGFSVSPTLRRQRTPATVCLKGLFGDHTWMITWYGLWILIHSPVVYYGLYQFCQSVPRRGGDDGFNYFSGASSTGIVDGGFGHNTLNYACVIRMQITRQSAGSFRNEHRWRNRKRLHAYPQLRG